MGERKTQTTLEILDIIAAICDDAPLPRQPGTLEDFQRRLDDMDERMSRILSFVNDLRRAEPDAAIDALEELHALVCGECPSLLNEDSGGDARLDMEIKDIIARAQGKKE